MLEATGTRTLGTNGQLAPQAITVRNQLQPFSSQGPQGSESLKRGPQRPALVTRPPLGQEAQGV